MRAMEGWEIELGLHELFESGKSEKEEKVAGFLNLQYFYYLWKRLSFVAGQVIVMNNGSYYGDSKRNA